MSITHSLKFQSSRSPENILQVLLSNQIGLLPGLHDQMKTKGKELYGRILEIDKDDQDGYLKNYGMQFNTRASFDETFEGDRDVALQILGRAFAFLLKEEKGVAMLFWVVDTPILRRVKGQSIEVTDAPEFGWLRNALDDANLKYELKFADEIQKS